MTDRELLELAAKAAGIDLQHKAMFGGDSEPGYYNYRSGSPAWVWWNPLIDDGDALRLAVMLHLYEALKLSHRLVSGNGVDASYAAARRAIVIAAAEIGVASESPSP